MIATSGKPHLAATNGGKPDSADAQAYGWRDGEPLGDRIGWIEGDDIYLQPDAAYRCIQSVAAQSEGLTISSQILWKRLNEAGYLKSKDGDDRLRIRKTIVGKREKVIHLSNEKMTG